MKRYVIWFFCCGLFLTQISCKRQQLKKSEADKTENKTTSNTDGVNAGAETDSQTPSSIVVQPEEVDFNYLKIKSKIDFSSPNFSQVIPATIQVKRDSVIWMSVAVGLEVGRGCIRPDSAIFLDRINRNVYRFSFAELQNWFDFPITYELLQSLIVGNMPFYVRPQDQVAAAGDYIMVNQQVNGIRIENTIDTLINKLIRLMAQPTQPDQPANQMVIAYSNFLTTPNGQVPQQVEAEVESKKSDGSTLSTVIRINHSKFEFLDRGLSFPFSIPNNYKEVKLKPKKK